MQDLATWSAERRVRLTKNRRRVLEMLLDADKPLTAYDLLRQLRKERPRAAPLTIYRALASLVEHRFVHRIASLNAYILCSDVGHLQASYFVICQNCGVAQEFVDVTIAARLLRYARMRDIEIVRQVVEVSGTCAGCKNTSLYPGDTSRAAVNHIGVSAIGDE